MHHEQKPDAPTWIYKLAKHLQIGSHLKRKYNKRFGIRDHSQMDRSRLR